MISCDLVIAFLIVLSLILCKSQADLVLLIAWIAIFAYFLLVRRYRSLLHLLMATMFAIVWVHFAKDYYGYRYNYLTIFGMNTLPLMAWSLTIMGLGELVNHLRLRKRIFYLIIFVPSFWFLLILFETVAYHILEIRNTVTGNFAGLPFCDCIHAPTWMKIVYFSMGPAYFTSTMLADKALSGKHPL